MNDASTSTNPALVRQLAQLLLAKKLIVATAESCTGGWIAQSLTALPGSSDWFDTGFVTYSNEAKQRLLEVPSSCLAVDGPGAVSAETVLAMTRGAIANSRANVAVAVSGIAGPDGGSIGPLQVGNINVDVLASFYKARPTTIYGGSNEIQRNILSKAVLGLPA